MKLKTKLVLLVFFILAISVGTWEDFEKMGEIARDAYLKYQFGRCYQNGYSLIRDGVYITNLTD